MQLFEKRMISWKLNLNVSNQQAKGFLGLHINWPLISAEWGYTAILNSLSSASAGVSILFNNNSWKSLVKTNYLECFKVISALRQYKNMCLPIDDSVNSKDALGFRLSNHQNLSNRETYETTKPMKPRTLWNLWNHETTKLLKPQTPRNHEPHETTKSMKPRTLRNQETTKTMKPMKRKKPRNLRNQEIYETTNPKKPRNLWNQETYETMKPRNLWHRETKETKTQSMGPMTPSDSFTYICAP